MKTTNPIRHTVAHFIEAGALKHERSEKRKASTIKTRKPRKSNFKRFFDSIENRAPLSIHASLFEKWTRNVRLEMEGVESWPDTRQEPNITIIAEYVSRLQKQFWNEHPDLRWYKDDPSEHYTELRLSLRTFKRIYTKIRNKGMRDRSFQLHHWSCMTVTWTFVDAYRCWAKAVNGAIDIRPYTEYNDHGGGI